MFAMHDENVIEDKSAQRFKPLMNFYLSENERPGTILLPQHITEGMTVPLNFKHSINP